MPRTWFNTYSELDQPTHVEEGPAQVTPERRATTFLYDEAGRVLQRALIRGGTFMQPTSMVDSPTLGLPIEQLYSCGANCPDGDAQAVRTEYDALGKPVKYFDADGNVSETAYDLLGRAAFSSDGKGSQLRSYDPTSGAVVQLHDSAAGTFTATYNADGAITSETLPNGLIAGKGTAQLERLRS